MQEAGKESVLAAVVAIEKVVEAAVRNQSGDATDDDHIVVQERTVLDAGTQVGPDLPVDLLLENVLFEHIGPVEPQKVAVIDEPQFRSDVEVHPEIQQKQTRIDEVRLALEFARPQVGHKAHAIDEVHAKQPDGLPLPITEAAASEVGVVENRVEAGGSIVVDILVAAGPEN